MNSSYRKIAVNAASNWGNTFVTAAIGFFIMPFMIHKLGDSYYGVWVLLLSIVGYGSLLDLGITSSIIKYAAQHHSENDESKLNELFTTALAVYLLIGAFVFCTAWIASGYLPAIFKLNVDQQVIAKEAFKIIGLNLGLKFPLGVFPAFIYGIQRYDLNNGINILVNIIKAALIVVFLTRGFGIIFLSYLTLSSDVTYHLVMLLFCKAKLPCIRFKPKSIRKDMLKTIYSFGVYSFIIAMASRVIYESSSIIIGIVISANVITFYAIANNLVRYIRQFAFGFGNVFNPAASAINARMEKESLKRLLSFGTKYSAGFLLPVGIGVFILGKEFIRIWMGARYASTCYPLLVILCLGQIPSMIQFASGSILYGLGRHKILAILTSLEAACIVAVSVFMAKKYALIGVALSISIPELVVYGLLVPAYVCRIIGVPIKEYIKSAFAPVAKSSIALGFVLFGLKWIKPPGSWAVLSAEILIGCSVYGMVAFFTYFDKNQRVSFGNYALGKWNSFMRLIG